MKKVSRAYVSIAIFTAVYVVVLALALTPFVNLVLGVLDFAGMIIALHLTKTMVDAGMLKMKERRQVRPGSGIILSIAVGSIGIHTFLAFQPTPSRFFSAAPLLVTIVVAFAGVGDYIKRRT